ncbi:MAG: transcriptional regulator, LuxR family [Acidimicrobiaceae bacterium]|nr:transcriptional regulator, LuxR family [Acidimicrobiaceae bacterium]
MSATKGAVATTRSVPLPTESAPRRLATYVAAGDAISRAGLATQLRSQTELLVVDDPKRASVAVLAVDEVCEEEARVVRTLLRGGCRHVVVVSTGLDDRGVLTAVEAGACAILRRGEASPERLAAVLVAAMEGHGTLPPDLLGSLLSQVGKLQRNVLQPRGLLFNGFTEREIEVLRLVADGLDTTEISEKLAYSERTVKNVLHDVTSRFNLRNRCHAVAYALRAGVI